MSAKPYSAEEVAAIRARAESDDVLNAGWQIHNRWLATLATVTRERDEARALLREAREYVVDGVEGRFTPRATAKLLLRAIDAHLGGEGA